MHEISQCPFKVDRSLTQCEPSPPGGSRLFVQMVKLHAIFAMSGNHTKNETVDDSRPLEFKVIFKQKWKNLARYVLYYCVNTSLSA